MAAISLRKRDFNMTSDVSMVFRHKGKGLLSDNARIEEQCFFIHSEYADTVSSNADTFFKSVKKAVNYMDKTSCGSIDMKLWRDDFNHVTVFSLSVNSSGGYTWKTEKNLMDVTKTDALNNIALFLNGVMTGSID